MTEVALSFPLSQGNPEALSLSQQTAQHLQKYTPSRLPIPIPFLSSPESTELWASYEKLLLSCLRTGDDKGAHMCLEKLIERFGATNERVMGLRGLYQEAVAKDNAALEKILREYDEVLEGDPANTPIMKRRIALLRSLGRITNAIDALVDLLDASPTDIEAWSELADLYLSQGSFSQAEYCLEEVLLVAPNAWNVHARLGEILYMGASNNESSAVRVLAESMRRFCRSIELCDGYLRGYYGLKLSAGRLSKIIHHDPKTFSNSSSTTDNDELPIPSEASVNALHEKATSALAQIVRTADSGQYNKVEVDAVKTLLDQSAQSVTR
ncbi:inositol-1,4,5-trisphosphate 5-phosphatase 1 [Physcia stellaris]|nr:inositol-1,4,5-trisphosphate 5-phosphatase 1 [Physcia stellaris]